LPRFRRGRRSARAWTARGTVDNIAFPSSFTAINPTMRKHGTHWGPTILCAHSTGATTTGPSTLCVIHASWVVISGQRPILLTAVVLPVRYDVLMFTLPFHARRAEKLSPFSGFGFFAGGSVVSPSDGSGRARLPVRHRLSAPHRCDRIALTGISLGGYTSALVASVDDRLEAVIPNCPVVTPATMFDEWFPANKMIQLGFQLYNISRDELDAGLSYHCALNYRPQLPRNRRMIITASPTEWPHPNRP